MATVTDGSAGADEADLAQTVTNLRSLVAVLVDAAPVCPGCQVALPHPDRGDGEWCRVGRALNGR